MKGESSPGVLAMETGLVDGDAPGEAVKESVNGQRELRIAPSSPVEDRCLGFLERLNTRRGLDGGVDELGLALTLRLSLSTVFSIVRLTRL
jgi:hypothetical protein